MVIVCLILFFCFVDQEALDELEELKKIVPQEALVYFLLSKVCVPCSIDWYGNLLNGKWNFLLIFFIFVKFLYSQNLYYGNLYFSH